jgi:hypothetical protein
MSSILLTVLKISLIEMLYLTGLLILVGLILGFLERLSNNFMQRAIGRKGILITAWLGTPIHEIGHALMCLLFHHKITKLQFLNVKGQSEVLGYVQHSYNKNNLYQRIGNLFIGLGPIFSGTFSLILALYLLLPHSYAVFKRFLIQGINSDKIDLNLLSSLLESGWTLFKSIFTTNNLGNPLFWLFIIIAICVSSHIALSKSDINGAKDGFFVLFVLIFIINLLLRIFSVNSPNYIITLGRYNAHLMAFLMIALLFSAITLIVSIMFYLLTNFKKPHRY